MGSLSIWHWIVAFVYIAIFFIPIMRILHKAGFSRWWSIISLLPGINIIFLWVFSFVQWPATRR